MKLLKKKSIKNTTVPSVFSNSERFIQINMGIIINPNKSNRDIMLIYFL